jgi:ubiquinone/menaquinone biosynthesis C-methylase UbiE
MPQSIRMKVLNEMRRVMKNSGRILLVDYHSGPLRLPMGWLYKAIILFFEIAAGREHYKNYRNFIKNGALPPLIDALGLVVDKKKIISKGNFAIYLLKV